MISGSSNSSKIFRSQNGNQKKVQVNSFQQEHQRDSKSFLKYLNSQQSQEMNTSKEQAFKQTKTLQMTQKYYLLCPELYESYRNEHCIQEINGDQFKIQRYSKGRNELRFTDIIEIELPNVAKLTVWSNGDYKLIYNEQVYYWHEEELSLDKYCVTI